MEAKRPILVTRNALHDVRIDRTMSVEKKIKTVFFIKQGLSKAQVTFNKDCFVHGETASAIV